MRELVKGAGAQQPGFVHNDGRAGRQSVLLKRGSVGSAPLMEQLGHGVGGHAGFAGQDAGGLGRRRDAEHRPPPGVQVVHGTPERGRLAGAGGPDDQHQLVATGDRRRSIGLQDVQPVPIEGGRLVRAVDLGVHGPGQHALLLGQDRVTGQVRGGGLDPHRTPVRRPPQDVPARRVEIYAVVDHPVARRLEHTRPPASRH